MKEYHTYHVIFQKLPSKREVKKSMGQNILKFEIIEVKDDSITNVNIRSSIFVIYKHVAYVPCDIVANFFGGSFLFRYIYRAIII